MSETVDLLFLGRIAVDLYGQQKATPLEETRSFARYPGGSSGNMAIAAARAGANVGLISAVGDDPMGRFLMQTLTREGVDTTALTVHPTRRTALAFLGMLDSDADQLDFYRTEAADTCIDAEMVPQTYLGNAARLAITGTHLADPVSHQTVLQIAQLASRAGVELVLDIDLRRDLWDSYAGRLSGSVQRICDNLALFKMIVGNEEEFELVLPAATRPPNDCTLVRKLGPNGASIESPTNQCSVAGHHIDVINPVGAGDAFLGNLLAAIQSGESREVALEKANAAGALVATRHGCANEMPFPLELERFLAGRPQSDPTIAHIHRTSLRPRIDKPVLALACDHRVPFDRLLASSEHTADDVRHFKSLVFESMQLAGKNVRDAQTGMLMDPKYGANVLNELAAGEFWVGRPIEVTGSRPIEFEAGHDIASDIASWRSVQVAKVLTWFSPDDPEELRERQIDRLRYLQSACRAASIEWMLELVPPLNMPRDDDVLCRGVSQCYDAGLFPDWWKLPALADHFGWTRMGHILDTNDPQCRGVLVLGLNESAETLGPALAKASSAECCQGFAVGRTIFGNAADEWFAGQINDQTAVRRMAEIYRGLIDQFLRLSGDSNARAHKT